MRHHTSVPDPDLAIRGAWSPKKIFSAPWASVWTKNKGELGPQGPPLDPPLCFHVQHRILFGTRVKQDAEDDYCKPVTPFSNRLVSCYHI